ncbi:hypothetical protein AB6831_04220 [Carnobacterium divergens]|uniref:hypothetical protein n=1 Tax=Carnobacterium divergens TaxID=2748 RepID=UPI0039C91F48
MENYYVVKIGNSYLIEVFKEGIHTTNAIKFAKRFINSRDADKIAKQAKGQSIHVFKPKRKRQK